MHVQGIVEMADLIVVNKADGDMYVRACVLVCVRACVRACMRAACMRACIYLSVRPSVRPSVHPCVRACMYLWHACHEVAFGDAHSRGLH